MRTATVSRPPNAEETVYVEGEFEAGRPAGLTAGTPVDLPLVVPFGPLVLASRSL